MHLLIDIISLYQYALTAWIIISWLTAFGIINSYQPLVRGIMNFLNKLIEPVLGYLRKYIPSLGGIDLSSIILYLLLNFSKEVLWRLS
jgi:YggT family protein